MSRLTRFGLCFSDSSWLGPVRFGSFPRPVPAGSRIKRCGSVRFGRLRSVSYSFLKRAWTTGSHGWLHVRNSSGPPEVVPGARHPEQGRRHAQKLRGRRSAIKPDLGKGQMGSALMWSLQVSCFLTEGLFGTPVKCVSPQIPGLTFFPVRQHSLLLQRPISVDPICP